MADEMTIAQRVEAQLYGDVRNREGDFLAVAAEVLGMSQTEIDAALQREAAARDRRPVHVRCGECNHIWVAAYTPMLPVPLCKLLGSLHCPNCGADATKIFMHDNKATT